MQTTNVKASDFQNNSTVKLNGHMYKANVTKRLFRQRCYEVVICCRYKKL